MMSYLIAVTLLFIPVTIEWAPCWTLSCIVPEVDEAVEKADAVFIGVVTETEIVEPTKLVRGGHCTIGFKVERTFKGFPFSERTVMSAQGHFGFCGHRALTKGERYLIYAEPPYENAQRAKGPLRINACSRTALLPESGRRSSSRFFDSNYDSSNGWEDLKALSALPARRLTTRP